MVGIAKYQRPMPPTPRRRHPGHRLYALPILAAWAAAAVPGCGGASPDRDFAAIRIGYQKAGTLNLLRLRGGLEPELAKLGVAVRWVAFPAGPQLLEAMNAGVVDYGHTGDAPPILAQAAGVPLAYVACEPERPHSEAILVPPGSTIRSLADLKGRRIALNKGSNVHNLLVRALESAGIGYDEIRPVYLAPADARAAFAGGSVDAWATWDPYFAEAELSDGAVVLADATGLVGNREFQLASRDLAGRRPDIVRTVVETLGREADWIGRHQDEAVRLFVAELGLDEATIRRVVARKGYGVAPITDGVIAEQQRIADAFLSLRLIPRPIAIRDAIAAPRPTDAAHPGR